MTKRLNDSMTDSRAAKEPALVFFYVPFIYGISDSLFTVDLLSYQDPLETEWKRFITDNIVHTENKKELTVREILCMCCPD